jgi:hypothetical protein
MRGIHVPMQEAYIAYRCWECPHFKEYGASFQDGNICTHASLDDPLVHDADVIPKWCPIAKDITLGE